jgi:hypothetical protein
MAGTLGEQGGWTPEMEKALMQTSTDYQLMTNKRLTDAQAQNARLRAMANRLKGAKMASDERLKIQSEKDKNDRNRASIQTQVAAINSRIAIANKDPFGQTNTDELKRASEELDNLQGVLSIMDDNSSVLDDLLEEKGGIKVNPNKKPIGKRKPLADFNSKNK